MSVAQAFVALFSVVSLAISASAIWLVARSDAIRYKPLWIVGCLLGFIGFATRMDASGDLYMSFGVQIPVIIVSTMGNGSIVLKSMFPIVANIALVKLHSLRNAASSLQRASQDD